MSIQSFSKQIVFSMLLTIVTFAVSFAQNKTSTKEEQMWSRIHRSGEVTVNKTPYIPIPQNTHPRKVQLPNGVAVVYPNIAVHPSSVSTQSELSIITHPTNPNIILGGSNAAEITNINWLSQGWYISTNGGTNWYGSDTLPPHLQSDFTKYTSDPAVAIDLSGNMFFNTLLYSSSTGDLVTTKSTDNGAHWSSLVPVPNTTTGEDKNHVTIDVTASSPYANNIYTAYSDFGGTPTRIQFSRSTDHGTTFTAPAAISNGASTDQGVNLQTGPNGEVYGTWTTYVTFPTNSTIGFNKSTDGGATWGTQVAAAANQADIRGNITKGGNSIRVDGFPSMAVDRSNGTRRGWIYITWSAKPSGNPDVMMTRSTDGGTTWSTPKKISQESTNRDQWHPWAAVDQSTGSLYVMYYDSRNFANNDSTQVYLSRSLDGGDTFDDVLVSDHAFLPQAITGLAGGYMGDYNSVAANSGMVHVFWNDNRSGHHLAYYSKVVFGPTIEHTPLANTENMAGPYTVSANITSAGVSLNTSSIKLFWTRGTTFADSVTMSHTTGDTYSANIPGNNHAADYRYYIQASDSIGGTSKSPAGAPSDYYAFSAATDTVSASITHTQLGNQFLETWPKGISADVTDNIGVDSVWCQWNVANSSGSFWMANANEDTYKGTFNTIAESLHVGDEMTYAIYAKDAGSHHNVSHTETYSFTFVADTSHPTVAHNPLRNQGRLRWPANVRATISDELGISDAIVEWHKNTSNNTSFDLSTDGNNIYQGRFNSDTNSVVVGDSIHYRIKATDASNSHNVTYVPANGYYTFAIIATKGFVLVISDDTVAAQSKIMTEKGLNVYSDKVVAGRSGNLFISTLTEAGYIADGTTITDVDPSAMGAYDIVVVSSGINVDPIRNDALRSALVDRAQGGGRIWIEGGEVGYDYRSGTSELDVNFRQSVLHDTGWAADNSAGDVTFADAGHPLFNSPNAITAPITFTTRSTYADKDAVGLLTSDPNAIGVGSWSAQPTNSSIIVWNITPNPSAAKVLFTTFAIGSITDSTVAKALIENGAEFLMAPDAPATGAISGTVTLQGAPNNSGVSVRVKGLGHDVTVQTGNTGYYHFGEFYPGVYKVYAWKTGYYPAIESLSVTVASDSVTGKNFTFTPLVLATIHGTVTLQDTNNFSGVTVEIVGQGISTTTNANGAYTLSNISPGNVRVRARKQGFSNGVKDTTVGNGGNIAINFTLESIGDFVGLEEGFEESFPPEGWTTTITAGDSGWRNTATSPYSGSVCAYSRYQTSGTDGSKWLITPQVVLSGTDNVLKFWMRRVYTTVYDPDTIYIRVSMSDPSPENFTTTVYKCYTGDTTSDDPNVYGLGYKHFAAHFGNLSGPAYIAFVHEDNNGQSLMMDDVTLEPVDAVKEITANNLPVIYSLSQNYPNPFNPTTTIRFGLPEASDVTLRVYNLLGQEVANLVSGVKTAGYYQVDWNGSHVASGVYFYRLEAYSSTSTKKFTRINKMIMLK